MARAIGVYSLRRQITELRAVLSDAADGALASEDWRRQKALDCLSACDEALQAALPSVNAAIYQFTRAMIFMDEPDVRTTPAQDGLSQGESADGPDPAESWKQ